MVQYPFRKASTIRHFILCPLILYSNLTRTASFLFSNAKREGRRSHPRLYAAQEAAGLSLVAPVIPILTPFNHYGDIDWEAMDGYLKFLWEAGVRTIVCNGASAEFASMTLEERKRLLYFCRTSYKGTIINNISSCVLAESRQLAAESATKFAGKICVADALLLQAPYYYSGSSEDIGIETFLRELLSGCSLPVMLYNPPHGTGGPPITPKLYKKLVDDFPIIAGIYEAAGGLESANALLAGAPHLKIIVEADASASRVLTSGLHILGSSYGAAVPEILTSLKEAVTCDAPVARARQAQLDSWSQKVTTASQTLSSNTESEPSNTPILLPISALKAGIASRVGGFSAAVRPPLDTFCAAELDKMTQYFLRGELDKVGRRVRQSGAIAAVHGVTDALAKGWSSAELAGLEMLTDRLAAAEQALDHYLQATRSTADSKNGVENKPTKENVIQPQTQPEPKQQYSPVQNYLNTKTPLQRSPQTPKPNVSKTNVNVNTNTTPKQTVGRVTNDRNSSISNISKGDSGERMSGGANSQRSDVRRPVTKQEPVQRTYTNAASVVQPIKATGPRNIQARLQPEKPVRTTPAHSPRTQPTPQQKPPSRLPTTSVNVNSNRVEAVRPPTPSSRPAPAPVQTPRHTVEPQPMLKRPVPVVNKSVGRVDRVLKPAAAHADTETKHKKTDTHSNIESSVRSDRNTPVSASKSADFQAKRSNWLPKESLMQPEEYYANGVEQDVEYSTTFNVNGDQHMIEETVDELDHYDAYIENPRPEYETSELYDQQNEYEVQHEFHQLEGEDYWSDSGRNGNEESSSERSSRSGSGRPEMDMHVVTPPYEFEDEEEEEQYEYDNYSGEYTQEYIDEYYDNDISIDGESQEPNGSDWPTQSSSPAPVRHDKVTSSSRVLGKGPTYGGVAYKSALPQPRYGRWIPEGSEVRPSKPLPTGYNRPPPLTPRTGSFPADSRSTYGSQRPIAASPIPNALVQKAARAVDDFAAQEREQFFKSKGIDADVDTFDWGALRKNTGIFEEHQRRLVQQRTNRASPRPPETPGGGMFRE